MSSTLADRLRARIRQLGVSPADVADQAEVNRSFVYDILRGRSSSPNLDRLRQVARVLLVDLEWLATGVGMAAAGPDLPQVDDEFVTVAYVHARPSMGGGSIIDDETKPGRDFHFRRAWIREKLKASPSLLRVMHVEGDSMIPTLEDGDTVLVDMNRKSPSPPGIFVLHDGMGLVAKRLEHIPMSDPPRIRISSDNERYAPYDCNLDEVNIVGRIRWFAREV